MTTVEGFIDNITAIKNEDGAIKIYVNIEGVLENRALDMVALSTKFWSKIKEGIEDIIGEEAMAGLLREVGYRLMKEHNEKGVKVLILNKKLSRAELMALSSAIYKSLGFGVIEGMKEVESGLICVVRNSFEARRAQEFGKMGKASCHFTSGVVWALLEDVFEKKCKGVIEAKCIAKGDRECIFTCPF
ncbi:MAG: hypothetical protein ACTSVF_04160 [Candidatus Asgardarchaeia archaeon]